MGKLKAAARNKMSASTFGLPGERKYPMPDRAHAANAKARATQQMKAGNLTAAEHARIVAKANAKLKSLKGSKADPDKDGDTAVKDTDADGM